MKNMPNFHGSDIEKVAAYYHIDKEQIINFSGNVNPLGLSASLKERLKDNIELVTSYPDPDYSDLKEKIASYANCNLHDILLGNGTTELIAHYIDYVSPKKALIIGPTYSEYEKKITSLSGEVNYFPLKAENNFTLNIDDLLDTLDTSFDLLVICNPNNPTGTTTSSDALYKVFDYCIANSIYILIDETYMDFVSDASTISAIPLTKSYSNLMVLRGFSKFFASPGLRLGYGICHDIACHEFINRQRHHWAINSLSAFAGGQLLTDMDFIHISREYIHEERTRIEKELRKFENIVVYPTQTNFFLVLLKDKNHTASELFEYCIKKGLMVRDATSFPFLHGEYFRFCINKEEENNRLLTAIREYLIEH